MTKTHCERSGMDNTFSQRHAAVVGTLDSGLRIDRISGEARTLFDAPLDQLIGESLLALVAADDVPTFLMAYAEAAASQRGVTLELNLCAGEAEHGSKSVLCEVLIVPLRPSPGCGFVLRPVITPVSDLPVAEPMAVVANRTDRTRATRPAPLVPRGLSDCDVPGVARLTTRELQIVNRLLDGHRPPGIARALFLSQSTVRNHLASVFRKLGVTSQEALLELFRDAPAALGAEPTPLFDDDRLSRFS
jgi:DNA-binding CsgD family transcriptional regulator